MNISNHESSLSATPTTYFSWACSLFGFFVHIFVQYWLITRIKLNAYIKAIFCQLSLYYLLGYLVVFACLIPILFYDYHNKIICMSLGYLMGSAGLILQSCSSLMSVLRYYIGWKTSNNKVYSPKVLVLSITLTMLGSTALTISITVSRSRTKDFCEEEITNKASTESILALVYFLSCTCIGIIADILMMILLKKMKNIKGSEVQLVPWNSSTNQNKNYDGIIPRNSTLISTGILIMAGFWFAFANTLSETLVYNLVSNLFIVPLMVKFTVSSQQRKSIVVPAKLQFHEPASLSKKFKWDTFICR